MLTPSSPEESVVLSYRFDEKNAARVTCNSGVEGLFQKFRSSDRSEGANVQCLSKKKVKPCKAIHLIS